MQLSELVQHIARRPRVGVPDSLVGYFKRRSITFADGRSDRTSNVCWLQSRGFTIDLRLPRQQSLVSPQPWARYSAAELRELANYEGWCADCVYADGRLTWRDGVSLQLHNRWSEPADLKRIGNAMIEFAPSGAYVEDWRLQASRPGPLLGLRLIEERDLARGGVRQRGGGLIVCGDFAGLVLGRLAPLPHDPLPNGFRDLVTRAQGSEPRLAELFGFETSLARGSLVDGYTVELSTRVERIGQDLLALDAFEYSASEDVVMQRCTSGSLDLERVFSIDTAEPCVNYSLATESSPAAAAWFEQERETLERYLEVVS